MSLKNIFDPDLAVLPILIAQWEASPMAAVITYQNNVLRRELGAWEGVDFWKFLDRISDGSGMEFWVWPN